MEATRKYNYSNKNKFTHHHLLVQARDPFHPIQISSKKNRETHQIIPWTRLLQTPKILNKQIRIKRSNRPPEWASNYHSCWASHWRNPPKRSWFLIKERVNYGGKNLRMLICNDGDITLPGEAGIQSLVAGFPLHEAWHSVVDSGVKLKSFPFAFSIFINPVPVCQNNNKSLNWRKKKDA